MKNQNDVQIGIMTDPSEDIISEINGAYKLGADYVELGMEPPEGLTDVLQKKKNKILTLLKKFSYPPIGHSLYWADLGSPYEKVRKVWIIQMKNIIVLASKLNIKKLNTHIYAKGILYKKRHQKIILDNYVKSLRELVRFAKKHKIKIMVENMPYDWVEFENFRYVVNMVPNLGVHLDIGHAFMTDGTLGIKKFISYFNKRIEHIHMHDNHGNDDEHLPLGKGKVDFRLVVKELKEIGYNKTITFEVFTGEKDLVNSIKLFKRLWNEP